jgi:hypothetical protein
VLRGRCVPPAADGHTILTRMTSHAEFIVLVTLVCSQLLVNIWMFHAKVCSVLGRRAGCVPC